MNPRYYDPETVGLDFKGMMADIEKAADGSVILLHGELTSACHIARQGSSFVMEAEVAGRPHSCC